MNPDTLLQSAGASSTRLYDLIADEVARMSKLVPDPMILDLGCGQGEFLKRLSSQGLTRLQGADGFLYTGVDQNLFQFTQSDLNQTLPFADHFFSIITAIEVIEHLENPRHFLREITRILKPGGYAIISTPHNESITSILSLLTRGYFSSFSDRCYPAHITPVLRVDLTRIMTEAKLIDLRTLYTDRGRIPKTALDWQTIFPFLRGRLFSDNFIMIGKKIG